MKNKFTFDHYSDDDIFLQTQLFFDTTFTELQLVADQ